ncbi:MAG: hypothetical protein ACOX6O_05325 [Christensenellales bacterium]
MNPPSRMTGLDQEVQALRSALDGKGFARRDRSGEALFVSDAPRRSPDAWPGLERDLSASGHLVKVKNGLAFISWDIPKSLAFCQALCVREGWQRREDSLTGFCRILARQHTAFTPDMLPAFNRALLLWDAGEAEALRRQAETALAEALRLRVPYPAFFLPLLLNLIERSVT